jgi:hypothetical protein
MQPVAVSVKNLLKDVKKSILFNPKFYRKPCVKHRNSFFGQPNDGGFTQNVE